MLSLEITGIYREIVIYRRKPRYGRILAVSGTNHTKNVPFALTVQECIDFIDFGCEVFVARADGGRTAVHGARKGARPYLATNPDASGRTTCSRCRRADLDTVRIARSSLETARWFRLQPLAGGLR